MLYAINAAGGHRWVTMCPVNLSLVRVSSDKTIMRPVSVSLLFFCWCQTSWDIPLGKDWNAYKRSNFRGQTWVRMTSIFIFCESLHEGGTKTAFLLLFGFETKILLGQIWTILRLGLVSGPGNASCFHVGPQKGRRTDLCLGSVFISQQQFNTNTSVMV